MATVLPFRPEPDPEPFKVQPHSVEAEQAMLGSALVNNAVLDRCPWLAPGDFFEPVHGRIWAAMQASHAAGDLADPLTLKRLFDTDPSLADLNGAEYIARMAHAASTIIDAVAYGRMVKHLARLRELAAIGEGLASAALRPAAPDAASIWAEYANRVHAVLLDESRPVAKPVTKVCVEILSRMEKPAAMWSTGLPALDKSLGGGIQEGYVIGLEARPKQFKTGVSHTLLLALAQQGVPSAYFALEMGSARLAARMLGHVGGFNSAMLRHVDDCSITKAVAASRKLGALPLWFADAPGMKFSRLRAAADQLATAYGVRAFVLDYWQLVQPDQPTRNKADFLAEVAQWCADHAHERGTTWIIASQENRNGESYGSDGLVKACDWHAVLHKHDLPFHLGERKFETLWMDVKYARDGTGDSIGDAQHPVLMIHPDGPHLAEISEAFAA